MRSFSYGDPAAIVAAAKACATVNRGAILQGKYTMSLTPTDLATVLRALSEYSCAYEGETDETRDNAGSLYSGILQTLDIEVI